jgi:DNA ligase (NAD+)
MLSEQQLQLIQQAHLDFSQLSQSKLESLRQNSHPIDTLSDAELIDFLKIANVLYRGGESIISDDEYDFIYLAELQKRSPRHPFLNSVEPELAFAGKTVDLPVTMLSTDKAYHLEDVVRWVARIAKAAEELAIDFASLEFKVTPKLDGYAAYDDGIHLYTRGDGRKGTDITRVFERGLKVAEQGERGLGAGEIVVYRHYFAQHLANYFDNTRNFQASVIKEKQLDEHAQQAIADGAAVFFPFALLPAWRGSWEALNSDFETIVKDIWHKLDIDVDGVIIEITHSALKTALGATRHHHRWQLAYKENLQTAEVTVISVTPQTSRAGRITPVAELEPVRLSGALLSRATAHHYRMVLDKGIGPGARIILARSGEVIPKIEQVLTPTSAQIPEHCPSCEHQVVWDGDYLVCPNSLVCPAQISHTMEHFFRTLKNNDGFGAATIKKLYENGIRSVDGIYDLTEQQLIEMGFGPKQSVNLTEQLLRSRHEAVPDWRFLAAFGVFRMGLGNCERLLKHHKLNEIFTLTEAEIVNIEGFAEKTAQVIVEGFANIQPLFDRLIRLGFNLIETFDAQPAVHHPLNSKILVFTGTFLTGSRDQLSTLAKNKGAKIASSVSAKTDYLVAGDNVGMNKTQAAQDKGVTVINEQQFLALIESSDET